MHNRSKCSILQDTDLRSVATDPILTHSNFLTLARDWPTKRFLCGFLVQYDSVLIVISIIRAVDSNLEQFCSLTYLVLLCCVIGYNAIYMSLSSIKYQAEFLAHLSRKLFILIG